jgi:5-formyltetrahydrofolate cyclo-ligase
MNNTKQQLRNFMKNVMDELSSDYRNNADRLIVDNILSSQLYKEARTVFTFINMGNEIETTKLIQQALTDEKTVCGPLCFSNRKMEARRIVSLDQIRINAKGIPEPDESCPLVQKEEIDLILVPCLVADRNGYRIGYGGGYYDTYLADYSGNTLLLCREKQFVDKIPTEPFDIPVNHYVSEKSICLLTG